MADPVASHGTQIAIEKHPVSGGTFTNVTRLTSDLEFAMTRGWAASTAHGDDIESGVPGPMRRDPVTFSGDLVVNDATHDEATGLQKLFKEKTKFGILWKGPSWSAGNDEIIASGHVTAFKRTAPNDEGIYGFEATVQLTGPMKIDGVTFGTVA